MRSTFWVKTARRLAVPLLLGALETAQASTAGRQDQASTEQRTLIGVVSDAMCGRTHMMKDKSDAECLRICVKQGAKYALVVGKEVYTLVGHEADLDKYAAQKVRVTGLVKGTTVTVNAVAPVEGGARKER